MQIELKSQKCQSIIIIFNKIHISLPDSVFCPVQGSLIIAGHNPLYRIECSIKKIGFSFGPSLT